MSEERLLILNEKQKKHASRLIREECANLDGSYCVLLDNGCEPCTCPQLISYSVLCKHFKQAILPLDPEFQAVVMKADGLKRCAACEEIITGYSRNALYCEPCATRRKRESKREWMRNNKAKSGKSRV